MRCLCRSDAPRLVCLLSICSLRVVLLSALPQMRSHPNPARDRPRMGVCQYNKTESYGCQMTPTEQERPMFFLAASS